MLRYWLSNMENGKTILIPNTIPQYKFQIYQIFKCKKAQRYQEKKIQVNSTITCEYRSFANSDSKSKAIRKKIDKLYYTYKFSKKNKVKIKLKKTKTFQLITGKGLLYLKFLCNPKINTCNVFMVISGHAQSGKKFQSINAHISS